MTMNELALSLAPTIGGKPTRTAGALRAPRSGSGAAASFRPVEPDASRCPVPERQHDDQSANVTMR